MKQNSLIIFFLFGLIFFTKTCFGQDSLVSKSFLNNKVRLLVPNTFNELSQETLAEKYPNPNLRPSIILTDKEEISSIKIIQMPQEVSDTEVARYKSFHITNMKKEKYLDWLGDGVKIINGRTIGFIKVIYTDRNTFSYFFFTSMDGKLLLITYNCLDKLGPALEETTEKIINSLRIE
ncbi:MAG: hypothetical protein ABIP79_06695 [Chitinophagaceae bacterium]